jgi:hypothetical protein
LAQRQYVFTSGFRALVVIADDWHAGHVVGVCGVGFGSDPPATSLPKFDDLTGASRT